MTFCNIDLHFIFSKFGLSQRTFLYGYVNVHIRREIRPLAMPIQIHLFTSSPNMLTESCCLPGGGPCEGGEISTCVGCSQWGVEVGGVGEPGGVAGMEEGRPHLGKACHRAGSEFRELRQAVPLEGAPCKGP